MKKDIADRWVAELRSGKYKQAQKKLYDKYTGGYCCLGVLSVLYNEETPSKPQPMDYSFPRDYVAIWAGMQQFGSDDYNVAGRYKLDSDEYAPALSDLNDGTCGADHPHTFAEIADIIEQNWEKL